MAGDSKSQSLLHRNSTGFVRLLLPDRARLIAGAGGGASRQPGGKWGLAIAARMAERHGGSIWVEASPNAGATFFFTLTPG